MQRMAAGGKQAGVDEHGAPRRGIEPAAVELRLRLTGAQKPPAAAAQRLHPGMVVIAVRPARGIDLPGGDADAAQRRHQKGGFLPAPPAAAAKDGERGGGAFILHLVAGLLMAPAVRFKHRLLFAKPADARPQRRMKQRAVVGEVLIVDARKEHIVQKQLLIQRAAPSGALTQSKRMFAKGEEEGGRVAVQVALGQRLGEKGHRLF